MEISLCMIVRNEEPVLARCLESVHDLVDEIIIIDTGSTDRTKEIAARFTDKIFDFTWVDDFSAARNFSFSKATKEYCMWLDADDILTADNRIAFLDLKNNLSPEVDAVLMPYHAGFTEDGRLEASFVRERIVRRNAGFQWSGKIHETMRVSGHVRYSSAAITHTKQHADSDRNFLILESIIKKGSSDLKTLFYYASELHIRKRLHEAATVSEQFFAQGGYDTAFCLSVYLLLHEIYMENKEYDKAFQLSMDCIPYCMNRSEFCCRLGYFYSNIKNDINEAAHWFEQAVNCPYPTEIGAVVLEQYYYYIPYFQLGNIYCKQKRLKESLACFKKALENHENDKDLINIIRKLTAITN